MSNTPPYPKDMPAYHPAPDRSPASVSGRLEPMGSRSADLWELAEVAEAVQARVEKAPIQSVMIAFGVGAVLGMILRAWGSDPY
jgi:hypothetical protein